MPISEDAVLEAIELHKAGLNMGEILKRTHCSDSGLSRRMLKYDYDIHLEMKRQKVKEWEDVTKQVLELYPYLGTLEIASRLHIRQSKVAELVKGRVELRSRSDEIKLNKLFNEARRQNIMVCSLCGEEGYYHETGVCGLCRSQGEECISEHDAWLELEAGWLSRNLPINNSPAPRPICRTAW